MKASSKILLALGAVTSVLTSVEAQGVIELKAFSVFAGKDAVIFDREQFGDDGPSSVSVVLKEEGLFVGAEGVATEFPGVNVTIGWTIVLDGDEFEQNAAPVAPDGSFVLATPSDDFFKIDERGSHTFEISFDPEVVLSEDSVSIEARVYAISGFETILPLIMLVVLALLSRNVYVAMFFGIWIGAYIIEEGNLSNSFKALFDDHMIPSITDPFNFRTIVFTLFLSGFIAMIKRAGGQDGFSNVVGEYATSAKSTQLAAVAAGVGLFFDDYSSVLILGSSFKKLTDRFHVSREKLAFVADATSAPIASIAPISSWIAFELSRIAPELDEIKKSSQFESRNDLEGEYPFFLSTIPSRFYPFYMLVVQVLLIVCGIEFGPMLYAERKTRLAKRTDGGDGRMEIPMEQDYTTPAEDTPRRAWNFFIPIGFFVISLIVSLVNIGRASIEAQNLELGEDEQISFLARDIFGNTDSFEALVYTTMGASLFALIFFLVQMKEDGQIVMPTFKSLLAAVDCRLKSTEDVALQEGIEVNPDKEQVGPRPLMYFTEGINTWVEGFKNLVPAVLILCMAFTIKSIVTGLGTDRFFTDIILNSDLDAATLPTIIFIISGLLAIATGTSFGTMSIMFPLVSFATFEKSDGDIELFTVALSSIMAGAVFGDHSSLISDTTILASIGSGCQIGAHVYTQLPYAMWAAMFAIFFGTLPAGFGASAGVMLGFGIIFISLATILVGAPIVAESGRLDWFSEIVLKYGKSEKLQRFKDETKEFAALNPGLIDVEPLDFLKDKLPCLKTALGWCATKVPFIKRKDTMDELEEITNGQTQHYIKSPPASSQAAGSKEV